MAEKILHSDIAEVGALKPLQDELIATIKILNTLEGDVKSVAIAVKGMLSASETKTMKDIDELRKKTEMANQAFTEQEKIVREIRAQNAKLAAVNTDVAKSLEDVRLEVQRANAANKENAKLTSDQTGAYEKASITLNKYRKAWKDLAIVNKENTAEAKRLKAEIDQLDATLKKVDASVGQHQRNVGNYASGFQGLRNSINQVTREFPAFVNSAQTGFMAISNNLPILIDQINQLKAQNAALNAEGQKGTPIWKALAAGFFSIQTVIGLGITAMVLYGKEIGLFFKEMFRGKQIIDAYKMTKEQLIEVDKQAAKSAVEENVSLTILLATAKDVSLSYEQRKEAVDQLQKTYPAYFANLKDEEILAGNTAKAERDLRDAILSKAKAQAATSKIIENESKILDLEFKRADLQKQIIEQDKKARDAARIGELRGGEFGSQNADIALSKLNEMKQKSLDLDKEIAANRKANESLLNTVIQNAASAEGLDEKSTKKVEKAAKAVVKKAEKVVKEERQKQNDAHVQAYIEYQDRITHETLVALEEQNAAEERSAEWELKRLAEKQRAKEQLMKTTANLLSKAIKEEIALKDKQIEREIAQGEKRQDALRDLASRGVQDANNTLAFEERKQAELEAKRERRARNQKRIEYGLAGIKAYSSFAEKNATTALPNTLKDITALTSFLNALPGFIEGTENVSQSLGKPQLKGRDGYIVRVDGQERIVDPANNAKIGNITNDDLADLAHKYNLGLLNPTSFDRVPMSSHVFDDRLIEETRAVKSELSELKTLIKNRPVKDFRYDEVNKMAIDIIKSDHDTKTISKKIGGLRG